MRSSIHALTMLVALTGCSINHDYQADAKRKIGERLSDPDSLKFRSTTERTEGKTHLLCGEFNAKNKLGGYTGYAAFSYVKNGDFEYANWDDNLERKSDFLAECLNQTPSAALKGAQEFHRTLERLRRGDL